MAREVDIQHRFINNPRIANKIVDDIQQRLPQEEDEWTSITAAEIEEIVIYGAKTNGGETG